MAWFGFALRVWLESGQGLARACSGTGLGLGLDIPGDIFSKRGSGLGVVC